MSLVLARIRVLAADGAWFGGAILAALILGTAFDQFREVPLGWRYQTASERMLAFPVEQEEGTAAIDLVTIEEVEAALLNPSVTLLDARPRVFHELGHLPGALSLSREQFEEDFALLEPVLKTRGKTLLVYCSDAGCEDAALVARKLKERGLGPLLLYPGGFAEWESAGRRVEVVQ